MHNQPIQRNTRSGLTLVEIMIALTVTLIVLGAMAQAFKFASSEIAQGRAILEMSNRLRNAEQLLRTDLSGLTVEVQPYTESEPNGYFEYIDGPSVDNSSLIAG
ncbi:MAG: prepilin-type N-terminal cleavage/methylation domain-containing protein, partial [Planctomycetota bacterium]